MQEIGLKSSIKIGIALLFVLLIIGISGFTSRESFYVFIIQYTIAFVAYLLILKSDFNIKAIIALGIVARVCTLFFTPELSNDFYRFIWDGELLSQGINPYDFTPNQLISYGQFLSNDYYLSLYHGMGELSQANYSCYPILNQFIFGFSTLFSDNLAVNTIIMKLLIIAADIGALWVGIKILTLLKLPIKKIGWYFLNPLIILEFSGNMHFEGVMIFFLLLFLYFIIKNNWMVAGLFLALAIQIKLIPLMFIPFVYKRLKWKQSLGFTAVTLLVIILLSQLLLNGNNIDHFLASLELYFNNFQFNASFFSWINAIYSENIGWDTTAIVGPVLGKFTFGLIILLAILKAYRIPIDLFVAFTFSLAIYYVFATTVHPWYLSLILVFSIFTSYKFGVLWTFIGGFSYLAYSDPNFVENKMLNSILYILLFIFIIYELKQNWRKEAVGLQVKAFFTSNRIL